MFQRDHTRRLGRLTGAVLTALTLATFVTVMALSAAQTSAAVSAAACEFVGRLARVFVRCAFKPAPAGRGTPPPVFPAGQYPVQLPAVSMLGARNDLPNPYKDGVDWGQLPAGRKWGSTASVTTAPDGTIWVVDRCGNSGAGGTTCAGAGATVAPIFQLDTSGKVLKSLGAGLFVSPHKLTVDKDGNLWLADNGAHQVFKLDQNGKVLMTLGKKGVAGAGQDEFDAPTEVASADNGDISSRTVTAAAGTAIGNARVVKFDKTGKFVKTWGRNGHGPGRVRCPAHDRARFARTRVGRRPAEQPRAGVRS